MIAAAGPAVGAGLFIAIGLAWTARLLRIGALGALDLAEKVSGPHPASALDWPELHVLAPVAPDIPGVPKEALVVVDWPAHPERVATLLVDLGCQAKVPARLLEQWCAASASVSPSRGPEGEFVLRRRQSLEPVRGRLVAEDCGEAAADDQQS